MGRVSRYPLSLGLITDEDDNDDGDYHHECNNFEFVNFVNFALPNLGL